MAELVGWTVSYASMDLAQDLSTSEVFEEMIGAPTSIYACPFHAMRREVADELESWDDPSEVSMPAWRQTGEVDEPPGFVWDIFGDGERLRSVEPVYLLTEADFPS